VILLATRIPIGSFAIRQWRLARSL